MHAPDLSRTDVTPVRAATGALTTTIAVSVPVFLVGGLAVQISDELGFSPAGLGLAVSAYFGASALASMPAGTLVERYGARRVARGGIALAALSLFGIAIAARSLWSLVAILALGAGANAAGQLASNTSLARQVPARRQGLSSGVKQSDDLPGDVGDRRRRHGRGRHPHAGRKPAAQEVRSAMKSQSASMASLAEPSGSGASRARASSA